MFTDFRGRKGGSGKEGEGGRREGDRQTDADTRNTDYLPPGPAFPSPLSRNSGKMSSGEKKKCGGRRLQLTPGLNTDVMDVPVRS